MDRNHEDDVSSLSHSLTPPPDDNLSSTASFKASDPSSGVQGSTSLRPGAPPTPPRADTDLFSPSFGSNQKQPWETSTPGIVVPSHAMDGIDFDFASSQTMESQNGVPDWSDQCEQFFDFAGAAQAQPQLSRSVTPALQADLSNGFHQAHVEAFPEENSNPYLDGDDYDECDASSNSDSAPSFSRKRSRPDDDNMRAEDTCYDSIVDRSAHNLTPSIKTEPPQALGEYFMDSSTRESSVAAPSEQGSASKSTGLPTNECTPLDVGPYRLIVDFHKSNKNGPVKSRVETQLAVKLQLTQVPADSKIKRLRLPRYTIGRIKFVEDRKSSPRETGECILDLETRVVCDTPMRKKDLFERAVFEARETLGDAPTGTFNDAKKIDSTFGTNGSLPDEKKKILPEHGGPVEICNQCMIRERKRADRRKSKREDEQAHWASDEKKRILLFNTPQIRTFERFKDAVDTLCTDTQMRICCYCRHQHEKDGFRVIFTLRDHTGTVVAQTISGSILITDDHKNSSGHRSDSGNVAMSDSTMYSPAAPRIYSSAHSTMYRAAHNSPPALRAMPFNNYSSSKRRKSSNVPSGLVMTPVTPNVVHAGANATSSERDGHWPGGQQWHSNPIMPVTPTGMVDTGSNYDYMGSPMATTWRSTTASTPASPTASQHYHLREAPQISMVAPSQGPCEGGLPVVIVGRNFDPTDNPIVMFGEIPAMTGCQSDTVLVCTLPPNACPETVIVKLQNVEDPIVSTSPPILFTYNDESDKELMSLALHVVGMKMNGANTGASPRDIALSLLSQNGFSEEDAQMCAGSGQRQHSDLEGNLLACLDAIDLDGSPHPARLNHSNKTGHTLLHLACARGMQKFTAALLARNVKPNVRDRNGYTPLHFAALRGRPEIVRKLLLSGADPTIRTRMGAIAAELGEAKAIVEATQTINQVHSRHRSSRSSSVSSRTRRRSRSNSSASSHPYPPRQSRMPMDDFYSSASDTSEGESSSEEESDGSHTPAVWASRRSSMHDSRVGLASEGPENTKSADTTASMVDTHGDMAASAPKAALSELVQHLQAYWPLLQNAADYQHLLQNPMARFQNPIARFNALLPPFVQHREAAGYDWSEFWSPPAYEELYPEKAQESSQAQETGAEKSSAVEEERFGASIGAGTAAATAAGTAAGAAAGAVAGAAAGAAAGTTSDAAIQQELHQQLVGNKALTPQQQEEHKARIARINKAKRIRSDRVLFLFWLPALVLTLSLMIFSSAPKVWTFLCDVFKAFRGFASGSSTVGDVLGAFFHPRDTAVRHVAR